MNRAVGWVAFVCVLALLDLTAYVLAPRAAFDPLHPRAPHWTNRPLVPRVRLHRVCWPTAGGPGCFYEYGGRYGP